MIYDATYPFDAKRHLQLQTLKNAVYLHVSVVYFVIQWNGFFKNIYTHT